LGIIIIVILVMLLGIIIYLLFKGMTWISKSSVRIKWTLSICGFILLAVFINKLFFEKLEFLQSKVYPNLYLIKHPPSNRSTLNNLIKQKVIQEMSKKYSVLDEAYYNSNTYVTEGFSSIDTSLKFYEYTTAWGFSNGTVHFIENKEDPGGFSSEELINYYEYQLANFTFERCKIDSMRYFGNLHFYKEGNPITPPILINMCEN